jgi:excisionase family DNA binding protein
MLTTSEKASILLGHTMRPSPSSNATGGADAIAQRVVVHLTPMLSQVQVASPWLDATEAAAYLRCPVSRVRKLTSTRELPCSRDGRRVLYRRDELDEFIRSGGATCP